MASPEGGSQAAEAKQDLKLLTQQAWVKPLGERSRTRFEWNSFEYMIWWLLFILFGCFGGVANNPSRNMIELRLERSTGRHFIDPKGNLGLASELTFLITPDGIDGLNLHRSSKCLDFSCME